MVLRKVPHLSCLDKETRVEISKQKSANIKILCSSPQATNHLLSNHIFIANARVVVVKDMQEPIHCNKCQSYSHMCQKCPNEELCASCTRPYLSTTCTFTSERHCVSCGLASNHASYDRANCPHFAKQAELMDACIPENLLPYFPILGQPWTFMSTVKNPPPTSLPSAPPPPIPL